MPEAIDIGFHDVILEVTGGAGDPAAQQTFQVHVLGGSVVDTRPEISSVAPRSGVRTNNTYRYQLTGHAPTLVDVGGIRTEPTFEWSVLRGPEGANVDANGLFTWTPTALEDSRASHHCVVRLKVDDGLYVSQSFVIPGFIQPNPGEPWDLDGSGSVDAVDIQRVINGVLGMGDGQMLDANEDGSLNAVDIQTVINTVLGIL